MAQQAQEQFGSGAALAAQTDARFTRLGGASNGVGAATVALFLLFMAPGSIDSDDYLSMLVRNGVAFVIYMAVALPLGRHWVQRQGFAPLARWLRAERPATDAERLLALRYPLDWARKSAVFWAGAALVFALLNIMLGVRVALTTGLTIVLGGVTACALQYLVIERILRPVTARALAGGAPPRLAAPGIKARLTMAWTLATGVPLLGLVGFAIQYLAGADFTEGQLVGGTLFLASVALGIGLLAMLLAARSVSDPVRTVRRALEHVEHGNFEVRAPVDDGSEIGMLQAGFNSMVAGLQERERLREAFGTFVDPGLTERVLEEGTDLAGEEVDLTVMFIDIRDFTTFAEQAEAQEVVARLNDLYDLIVPVILRHHGHASKFIGDGLLAVFGAPERLPNHADQAVAAALEIARAVRERYADDLRIGIGINSGRVVAGTVGGGGRLDFTVIGDPVNTAARVEAATRQTGDDILITEATLTLLERDYAGWDERPPVPLKGKREVIGLYAPPAPVREVQPAGESGQAGLTPL